MNNEGIVPYYRNIFNELDGWKRKVLILTTSVYLYSLFTYYVINLQWFINNIYFAIFCFFLFPLGLSYLIKAIYKVISFLFYQNPNDNDRNEYKLFYMNNNTIKNKIIDKHTYIESSDELCDLCMSNYINIILTCHKNHKSCMNCIIEWCRKDNTCPYCRVKIIEVIK